MNVQAEVEEIKGALRTIEGSVAGLRRRVELLEGATRVAPVVQPRAVAPVEAVSLPPPSVVEKPAEFVPPVLARVVRPTPAPEPPRTNRWREWLEPLQLWPPASEENQESRLVAWWATRLGAALAVIGLVFFGIYVSRNSVPWVRLGELLAATAGVLGGGHWLERKLPKFGAVIVGAGLALLYFCAYAAYALPAVKTIESPFVGVGWQAVAVLVVFAAAWWRGSPATATMAVVLGFLAAAFSVEHDAQAFALVAALMLGGAAVGLRWGRDWEAPSALGVPCSWLLFLQVTLRHDMAIEVLWGWAVLNFALFYLRDWVPARQHGRKPIGRDRAVQTVNSSLALVGVAVATLLARDSALGEFYFGAGGLLLAAALGWWWLDREEPLAAVFFCKAASLVALGVIDECEGRSRALVLLAQAGVLLLGAKQTGMRSMRVMLALVWAVAAGFFIHDVVLATLPFNTAVIGALVFLTGSALMHGWHERWFEDDEAFHWMGGALVGVLGLAWLANYDALPWLPMAGVGIAVLLAGAAWVTGGARVPLLAAALIAMGAHFWAATGVDSVWLWWNELGLLGSAVLAGWLIDRTRASNEWAAQVYRGLVVAIAVGTLVQTLFIGLSPTVALAAAVGVGLAMAGLAPRWPQWRWAAWSTLAVAIGLLRHAVLDWRGGDAWVVVAAMGALLLPAWLSVSPVRRESLGSAKVRDFILALQIALGSALALMALEASFAPRPRLYALAAGLLLYVGLAWRAKLSAALPAASVVALIGLNWMLVQAPEANGNEVLAVVVAAAAVAAVPLLARKFRVEAPEVWREGAPWVHAGLALLVVLALFQQQRGGLAPYVTVLCAGAAIATFVAGLFGASRAYRLVGLGGLALCVARLFAVDLHSMLYRILAFVALGGVLLFVGFSYHRFRHLIADEKKL